MSVKDRAEEILVNVVEEKLVETIGEEKTEELIEFLGVKFSQYAMYFITYWDSFFDILEGTTGAGKSVVAAAKFILKVCDSAARNHVICCQNLQKTEQNLISDPLTGMKALFRDEDGEEMVEYCPNGRGEVKVPHLRVHCEDGDKIIYFISYSDSTKSNIVRSGRYGCSFIDEINLIVDNKTPIDQVSPFVTELISRSDDYIVATLNPDDPDLPLYKEVINCARPVDKYRTKGPKEIRNMLSSPENPEYKWWFFDFYDNPSMTEKRIERIKNGCRGNKKDWLTRILGYRAKTESLAFPNFDDEINVITEDEVLLRRNGKTDNRIIFRSFFAGVDTSFSSKTDDLLVFIFAGITTKGDVYILDEFSFNNRDVVKKEDKVGPSKVPELLFKFLSINSKKWGYPEYTFIDEADAGTILEIDQYKKRNREPFSVVPSAKRLFPIPSRIKKVNDLINSEKYFVVDTCRTHIHEMNVMALDPKDSSRHDGKNDHSFDAMCYAISKAYVSGWLGSKI